MSLFLSSHWTASLQSKKKKIFSKSISK